MVNRHLTPLRATSAGAYLDGTPSNEGGALQMVGQQSHQYEQAKRFVRPGYYFHSDHQQWLLILKKQSLWIVNKIRL